ncbi:hypothetical protein K505DRAFT_366603 [Melanomma pulvis-pyrius CBS 109.77]|uniref:F-box domain-containing protein n=1 Tax=Melanomma pulvis-pyrius CBS 109.77 TaxID=1314802 RepID=A0A6A6WWK7_9PLEO|nr:hypothetical protein K505DRAFT_366603 [Melanomma pulvis-pyrius CBS 109.77]
MGSRSSSLFKDHVAGIPVGLLRFIVFVPFGIYNSIASNHWNVIRSHPELHSGIYGSTIANGETFAQKWASFGFYWNFAVWVPTIIVPPPFSLIFGIVDAAIAVLISLSTKLQSGYSPHDIDRCGGTGAHDWGLPPGANESFFEASARLNATATNSFQMCKSYVVEWQYGIVLAFFYSLIAFINISVCTYSCLFHFRETQRQNRSFVKWILDAAIVFPKAIGIMLVAFLWYIPVLVFRCLPIGFKAPTRHARRYTAKTGLRAASGTEVQLEKLAKMTTRRKDGKGTRYQGGGTEAEPTKLADFLGIYDILMLVVEDLHYTDIVNLSLASKSVREAVLPAEDYERRLNHFRMYTCESDSKEQCWVCTNQICYSCTRRPIFKQTTPYHHLDVCNPYCTHCYKVLTRTPRPTKGPPVCTCAPATPTPNIFQRIAYSSLYYSRGQVSLNSVLRHVCQQCASLSEEEVYAVRRKRTERELRGTGKEAAGCGKCKAALGGGPRWWVCRKCELECTAFCHRAWAKGGKGGKGRVVVGDEAV